MYSVQRIKLAILLGFRKFLEREMHKKVNSSLDKQASTRASNGEQAIFDEERNN
jgi:hypothetical protein